MKDVVKLRVQRAKTGQNAVVVQDILFNRIEFCGYFTQTVLSSGSSQTQNGYQKKKVCVYFAPWTIFFGWER